MYGELLPENERLTYDAEMQLDRVQSYLMEQMRDEFYKGHIEYMHCVELAWGVIGGIRGKYCCGHCDDLSWEDGYEQDDTEWWKDGDGDAEV